MKYEILPDHRLRIFCDKEEQQEIRDNKNLVEEAGLYLRDVDETYWLESLIANSELEWIDPADTGDLTSAPMLGILDGLGKAEAFFGKSGCGECGLPIIARWAYMSYQVRSFLDDLAESGECFWDGGYAEGMRPDAVELSVD